MKWINSFEKFKESLQIDLFYNQIDLMESLSIWHDVLLKSVSADEVDLQRTLNLSVDFENISDINYLSDNVEFINSLKLLLTNLVNSYFYMTSIQPQNLRSQSI